MIFILGQIDLDCIKKKMIKHNKMLTKDEKRESFLEIFFKMRYLSTYIPIVQTYHKKI